jgi:hypothetical protein
MFYELPSNSNDINTDGSIPIQSDYYRTNNNSKNKSESESESRLGPTRGARAFNTKIELSASSKTADLLLDEYEDEETDIASMKNIYRYKISEELMQQLYQFSKIHQYDHRKDFKEAWNVWLDENDEMLCGEKRRLMNLGYEGDVEEKLFKSARYYFRKKSTEKKAPKERRSYIGVDKLLLNAMDEFLKKNSHLKPEHSFDEFCKINLELLKKEVSRLCNFGLNDAKDIQNKIKKTYKNRYFILNNMKDNKDKLE